MKRRPKWSTITIALAVIAALAIASPVLGVSNSIKKAIKKEVSKQISSATGPAGAAGPQGPPGPLAPSEPYREVGAAGEPVFQNGWANFDAVNFSTAGFYKDALGVVHLKGTLVHATVDNTVAFQLPLGYRPSKDHTMPMASEGPVAAKLEVHSNGEVRPECETTGCVTAGIDGLTFRVP